MVRPCALLFVLVACASSPVKVRRPVITDQTPLGMEADATVRWFQTHDWCFDVVERDRARAHLCKSDRPVIIVLGFRHDRLVRAVFRVPVRAIDLVDATESLAHELELRYGKPDDRSGAEPWLVWVTKSERIVLYAERGHGWIVERHTPATDPEEPYRPWVVDDFWIVEHGP